jgi:hypothetical protein
MPRNRSEKRPTWHKELILFAYACKRQHYRCTDHALRLPDSLHSQLAALSTEARYFIGGERKWEDMADNIFTVLGRGEHGTQSK